MRVYTERKKDIDLVVIDLGLPNLGGEEVAVRILAGDPDAKVVVSSGFIDLVIQASLSEAGVQKFVHKPYSASAVLKAIGDILDSKG